MTIWHEQFEWQRDALKLSSFADREKWMYYKRSSASRQSFARRGYGRPHSWGLVAILLVTALATSRPVNADTVEVNIPSFLGFNVYDVRQATTGSPDPFTVGFSNAIVASGNTIRISVMATAPTFTPPAGPGIPVSNVTWAPSGAVHGSGSPGILSDTDFAQVYESIPDAASGSVNLTFTLAAPGAGIRAGNHTLGATWKIESVSP